MLCNRIYRNALLILWLSTDGYVLTVVLFGVFVTAVLSTSGSERKFNTLIVSLSFSLDDHMVYNKV
jgi:hypothetical protein